MFGPQDAVDFAQREMEAKGNSVKQVGGAAAAFAQNGCARRQQQPVGNTCCMPVARSVACAHALACYCRVGQQRPPSLHSLPAPCSPSPLYQTCNRLIHEAIRERKCKDNCTVLLLRFDHSRQ